MKASPFAEMVRYVLLQSLQRLGATPAIPPRRDGTPPRAKQTRNNMGGFGRIRRKAMQRAVLLR